MPCVYIFVSVVSVVLVEYLFPYRRRRGIPTSPNYLGISSSTQSTVNEFHVGNQFCRGKLSLFLIRKFRRRFSKAHSTETLHDFFVNFVPNVEAGCLKGPANLYRQISTFGATGVSESGELWPTWGFLPLVQKSRV
jgi:hypothetical protein